jgi:uncharacterized membrane protein YqjE
MASSHEDRTVAELVSAVAEQSARLVRAEIDLAKAEMKGKAKQLGAGVGMFGAAAVVASCGIPLLVTTVVLLLALMWPAWVAALVVAVMTFAVAGGLVFWGAKKVKKGSPLAPQAALESLKDDIAAVKKGAAS